MKKTTMPKRCKKKLSEFPDDKLPSPLHIDEVEIKNKGGMGFGLIVNIDPRVDEVIEEAKKWVLDEYKKGKFKKKANKMDNSIE